jgi:hypothetical protein
MANITDVPRAVSPAVDRIADAHARHTPRRGLDLKKWRARLVVLLMIAAAVFGGSKLAQARNVATAQLPLGAVTLTASDGSRPSTSRPSSGSPPGSGSALCSP